LKERVEERKKAGERVIAVLGCSESTKRKKETERKGKALCDNQFFFVFETLHRH
jgi:hypothetical protein